MKESSLTKKIAEKLSKNQNFPKSKTGSILFFNENYVSSLYAEKFDIPQCEREQFEKAFLIVTSGVGNEAAKVNSVTSSSLLSLLAFYRLFGDNHKGVSLDICLNGTTYTFKTVFFETRNKVIGYPSCMDIVLQATDGTLLFLESKFTEYIDGRSNEETYGSSYYPLYKAEALSRILEQAGIKVSEKNGSLVLSSHGKDQYIEGIKQSISHLIGLTKGPQDHIDQYYDARYLDSYKLAFKNAPKIYYGTILFDPSGLFDGKEGKTEQVECFEDYESLFTTTIGEHGSELLKQIVSWINKDEMGTMKIPNIEVVKKPITYQDLFSKNPDFLLTKVAEFYHL